MAGSWGSAKKQQFLWQLHQRVGHPFQLPFRVAPFRFEIGDDNWQNSCRGDLWRDIDQLEAVVEFYANFTEPWGDAPWDGPPLKPGDPGYRPVSLRDPAGERATVAGKVVTLDGNPDLSDIICDPPGNGTTGAAPGGELPRSGNYPPQWKFLYDTLYLEEDTGRGSKTYRIKEVDNKANPKTVTLDAEPNCHGKPTRWRLNRRPIIVIIDPIGPRVRTGDPVLRGAAATVVGIDPDDSKLTVLRLDGKAPLKRVNKEFDTIYLESDTSTPAGPGPVYRIMEIDEGNRQVTVEGQPNLGGQPSAWQIPAGLGGVPPTLDYDLGPQHVPSPPAGTTYTALQQMEQQSRGYDHYDGALFLVHRGEVVGQRLYRWSTYTSRVYGTWGDANGTPLTNWQQELSSVRGNARYYYYAYRSDEKFKNYTFAVVDCAPGDDGLCTDKNDHIAAARFYTGTPAPPAPPAPTGDPDPDKLDPRVFPDAAPDGTAGKKLIRLHRGNFGGKFGSGSAGCMVSPEYVKMRTDLLKLFESDYAEYYGEKTFDAEVRKVVNANSNSASETLYKLGTSAGLTGGNWNNKVVGTLWVIRPDERPISGT
jgi:hypothetical protein